jgi:hypothetical protein
MDYQPLSPIYGTLKRRLDSVTQFPLSQVGPWFSGQWLLLLKPAIFQTPTIVLKHSLEDHFLPGEKLVFKKLVPQKKRDNGSETATWILLALKVWSSFYAS